MILNVISFERYSPLSNIILDMQTGELYISLLKEEYICAELALIHYKKQKNVSLKTFRRMKLKRDSLYLRLVGLELSQVELAILDREVLIELKKIS